MPVIEVIYENGVFRPLNPVELPEDARAEVFVTAQSDQLTTESKRSGEKGEPAVGEELAALLDEVASLPYTPYLDGLTDISSRHDDILYPKAGNIP